ncbi:MAG: peptidoglycan-binding domain-containing protein, partial [Candidatus Pacebacteria bacterium]|nr:peptidoglycan-binding domain-containing protein [Candidatus Paceibacterota bacterium]
MNIKKTAVITAIAGVVLGASFAAAQVTTTSSCYQFNTNLRVGNTGADVKALQQTLNARGFTVAAAGQAGSAGMETSYFGNATKNALIKWQDANASSVLTPWGLTSGTGFFGATSRAEMNKCAVGTVPTDPTNPTNPVSGSVAVSLAQIQPNNVLVQNSVNATLVNFVFSGNGTVVSVKLQRTGISNYDTLTNVYLYDANTGARLTDAASVLTDSTITFTNGTGLFNVAGSRAITVKGDIKDEVSGQSVGVSLIGYTVAGNAAAVVSGL